MVKTRIWTAALVLGLLLSLPAGCQVEDVEEESRIFAMDTVMTLTYHGQDRESGREALEEGVAEVYELRTCCPPPPQTARYLPLRKGTGTPLP